MTIYLPPPLTQWTDRLLADLLTPPGTERFEFAGPPGAAALTPPDSVSWRVFSNPVTVFIGGIAAVLLQLAEPRVRHGVWDNTSFRKKPLERLQRTGLAAMITVYAPAAAARQMIERINRIHAEVRGVTDRGEPYRADDPELLRWVHATATFGFLEAYRRFGSPVSRSAVDAYYAETAPVAELFGALNPPRTDAERLDLFGRMAPRLEPSPVIEDFLTIMERVAVLPRAARPAQRLLVRAGASLVPPTLASRWLPPGHGLKAWEWPLVRAIGKAAGSTVIASSPAVESCRRLGLPASYLYSTASKAA